MTTDHTTRPGVKSDETLVSILAHLRDSDGAGVTELANRLGLAKSTVHDHLVTMGEHGLVVKDGETYRLGLEFFNYGQAVRTRFPVYEAAMGVVDDLAAATGEMAWLTTPENGRVMFVHGDAGETDINVNTILGSWAYMHCNSSGKAILAHYDAHGVDAVVDRWGLPAQTANTITDRDALDEELEQIRERGYALNQGEDLEGIHAIGVPVRYENEVQGALAVAGPAHRVTRERCESELVDKLVAAVNDVEVNLAYA